MLEKYSKSTENFEVERNPHLYYVLVELAESVTDDQIKRADVIRKEMYNDVQVLREKSNVLKEASDSFMEEVKANYKNNHNSLNSLERTSENAEDFMHQNLNFVVIMSSMVDAAANLYQDIYELSKTLKKPNIIRSKQRIESFDDLESFDRIIKEININGRALESFAKNIDLFHNNRNLADKLGENLYRGFEQYYKMLLQRHTVSGTKIYKDPVITDVAIRIFENVDAHGEIESGKKANEVSAYTVRKAEVLAKAIKDDSVYEFLNDPNTFIKFVCEVLANLESFVNKMSDVYKPQLELLYQSFGAELKPIRTNLAGTVRDIRDVNPLSISYVEPKIVLSETDKMMYDIKSETLENVVRLLLDKNTSFEQLIQYILGRKAELKKFLHEENCFYVCQIGTGNMFAGIAPGGLQVVPAERPKGDIKDILGSGFEDVREFANSIKNSEKWHNLFIATSPSKSADKSNALLIGPPGCGKTLLMKSIGSQKDSVSIFAQSSDFKTAWAHESNKNPKRLFEAGLKLTKESGKRCHFLIDEIDEILNDDMTLNNDNLTKEFQILMDGVVSYPNLSIWGATNNPERIPTAMLRRFNSVHIVGELNSEHRIQLLKKYIGHMPTENFTDKKLEEWSSKLEGAVGDTIRKVCDNVWRKKMNNFVSKHEEDANDVLKWLQEKGEFDIEKLDRKEFKKVLGSKMLVRSIDIDNSIEECLANVAINQEIQTAVETYKRAKEFLNKLKK